MNGETASAYHIKNASTVLPAPRPPAKTISMIGGNVTGSVQVARCLTLLSQDEGAATAFYSRLHQHAGVPSAAKMLAMLVRCSLVAARAEDTAEEEDEEEDGGGGVDAEAGGKERGRADKKGKRKGLDDAEGGGGKRGWMLKASDSKVWLGDGVHFCGCGR